MVIFGFCKDWAVEKCTEPVFKMFRKPRNEQNKSRYFFLKRPVVSHVHRERVPQKWLTIHWKAYSC